MLYIKTCEYNIDSGYLEAEDIFGNKYAVDAEAVEDEFTHSMYSRSTLDYLLYYEPIKYLDLLLSGNLPEYLLTHKYGLDD